MKYTQYELWVEQYAEPEFSFTKPMTAREKVSALVEFGLADDTDEALEMLVDMGEVDDGDPSVYAQDPSGLPDPEEDEDW